MDILILTEPSYLNSPWCKKIIKGISNECIKRNYDINTADFDKFYKSHSSYLDKSDNQIVLVLGRNETNMVKMANFLNSKGCIFIFLNYKLSTLFPETHSLLFGFDRAIYSLIHKLTSVNKFRTALVGINPYSYAETEKRNSFKNIMRMYFPEQKIDNNIFYLDSTLEECFEKFYSNHNKFDNILCANDFVAIYFYKKLKEKGIKVPEECHISSFVDTKIGKLYSSEFTTISFNYNDFSRQVIFLSNYLCSSPDSSPLTIYLDGIINFPNMTESHLNASATEIAPMGETDSEMSYIQKIEEFLNRCSSLDIAILKGILKNQQYVTIAMNSFVSESTVKYHVKKILNETGLTSRKQLVDFLSPILGDVIQNL